MVTESRCRAEEYLLRAVNPPVPSFAARAPARQLQLAGVSLLALLLAAEPAAAQVNIDGGNVVAVPGTHDSPLDLGTTDLRVGFTGNGTLIVQGGGVVSSGDGFIGFAAGSDGTATVTGAGSSWTNTALIVGEQGTGELTVAAGGRVVTGGEAGIGYFGGSSGTVTVTGAGSTWEAGSILRIGQVGTGVLLVEAGGRVDGAVVTLGATGSGTATVTGAGSVLTGSSFLVGDSGSGTLIVEAGGRVSGATAALGGNAGSDGSVTVTGTGSTFDLTGHLRLGDSGTLTIENGGAVSNTLGYIGFGAGSSSTVTVTGADSSWTNSSLLLVGYEGTGELTVENGGAVSSHGGIIGYSSGISGTAAVTGAGSSWTSSNSLTLGYLGSAELTVADGGLVSVVAVGLGEGAGGSGELLLSGTAGARGVLETGYVVAGPGTALVTLDGGILRATGDEADFLRGFAAGEVQLAAGGGYFDSNGFDIAVATDLGGSGGLTKLGEGTLTLTGDSSYTGGTTVHAGTLALDGGAISHAGGTTTIGAQAGDDGTLVLRDGATLTNGLGQIGRDSGSTGAATVTGNGSSWSSSSGLYVGYSGSGELLIEAGGSVTANGIGLGMAAGGSGSLTVTGSGSSLLANMGGVAVGFLGSGEFTITAGGVVSSGFGWIGRSSGGSGAVTVSGAGSAWNTDTFYVGYDGSGDLSVEDGGLVTASGSWIGWSAGSSGSVTVRGAGSALNSSATLLLGFSGSGALTIADGGLVSSTSATLAFSAGSVGTLLLEGDAAGRGVLETGYVLAGSGSALVTFDGGVLRAREDEAEFLRDFAAGEVLLAAGGGYFDSNGFDIGVATDLEGAGGLFKLGEGTLTLTGDSSYAGGTTVRGGTLELDGGSITHAGAGVLVGAVSGDDAALVLRNGATLAGGAGRIGDAAGSAGAVTITGAGSSWSVGGASALHIGNSGEATLTIADGGSLTSGPSVSIGTTTAGVGTVTVTGASSSWVSDSLIYVGFAGQGTLTVADGGLVSATVVQLAANGSASSGSLVLEGDAAGRGTLETRYVSTGAGTALLTFDGGILRAARDDAAFLRGFAAGAVQFAAGGGYFDSNGFDIAVATDLEGSGGLFKLGEGTLTLTGDSSYAGGTTVRGGTLALDGGSISHSGANSAVGVEAGDDAALVLRNGATFTGIATAIGIADGSQGAVTVTGATTSWINGGALIIGLGGSGELRIEDGGLVTNTTGTIGSSSGSSGAATVTGADSRWTNSAALTVGSGGSGALLVEAGGRVDGAVLILGGTATGSGTATVTGAGSVLTGSIFLVGDAGNGALTVAAGATASGTASLLGNAASSSGSVTVTGAGSVWTLSSQLQVGHDGSGVLTIEDGGAVSSASGTIANGLGSSGAVTVTGMGSSWMSSGLLIVGYGGDGELRVENGGAVASVGGIIGSSSGSSGTATVTGAGSSWTSVSLGVGNLGTGELTVADGGLVAVTLLRLAQNGGASGTLALDGETGARGVLETAFVEAGAGSALLSLDGGILRATWDAADFLSGFAAGEVQIGAGGGYFDSNGFDIGVATDLEGSGGLFKLGEGTLTLTGDSSYAGGTTVRGGTLELDGGSISHAGGETVIGQGAGEDAGLIVSNGGTFTSGTGSIGYDAGAGGSVTVTGAGSSWASSSPLYVGRSGTGDLSIADGGVVSSGIVRIGMDTGSSGTATVTGTGSVWNGLSNFFVGSAGSGELTVEEGGAVTSLNGIIGWSAGSDGSLTVTGTGSSWTSSGALTVGNSGEGVLRVEEGGLVTSASGGIGGNAGSSGSVTVTGSGSAWTSSGVAGLYVGRSGEGTLTIEDGGLVAASQLTLAEMASGDGLVSLEGDAAGRGVLATGYLTAGAGSASLSFDGGILRAAGDEANFLRGFAAGSVQLESGGGYIDSNGFDVGIAAELGGAGGLTKLGEGTLTLTGSNSYGGPTTVEEGSLRAGSAAAFVQGGAYRMNGGTLDLDGFDLTMSRLEGNGGTVALGTAELTLELDVDTSYGGAFAGTGGIVKTEVGRLTLTGDSAAFGGATTISSGTLLVEGVLGGSLEVSDGATLGGSGRVGTTVVADGGILAPGSSIGTLTVDGDLSLSAGSILEFELGAPGAAGNPGAGASDRIVVTGDLNLDGTLNLAQSSDPGDGAAGLGYYRLMTYGGALTDNGLAVGTTPTVDGGAFEIQTGGGRVDLFIGALGDDSLQHWQGGDGVWNAADARWLNQSGETAVAWAGGVAIFKNEPGGFDGGTVSVAGTQSFLGLQFVDEGYRLEGAGALRTAAGGSEIRVLADGAEIATEITGTGGIVKTEAGRLVLSGTNSYQGGTTISAGTLEVSADTNLGAASGGLVLGGGTLATTASFTSGRAVTLNGAGGFEVAAATTLGLSGAVTGAGDIVKRGDGTLVLTGSNAYGDTRVEAGSLIGNAGSISGAIANAGTVVFDQAGNAAFAGDIGGLGGTSGTMVKQGGGTLTLAGTSQLDWTIEQGGLVTAAERFGGDAAIGADGSLFFAQNSNATYAGAITGAGNLVKTEAGRLTLTGTNSYQGGTTISAGTLEVSADANLGAASGGLVVGNGSLATTASFTSGRAVTLSGSGGFEVAAAATLGLSGAVTGASDLVKRGYGTLVLTGSNAYGDTRVEAGSLIGNVTSISGAVANAGSVVFDQGSDAAFAGDIGGLGGTSGTMVKRGGGTLTLAGTSQLDWTIQRGGLVTAAERFGGDAAIGADGSLIFVQNSNGAYAGAITGAGNLVKTEAGRLTLTGDSAAFGGVTTVSGGELRVEGTLGGTLTVGTGTTLSGNGSVGGTLVEDGGRIAPGNSLGTLTVAGDLGLTSGAILDFELGGPGPAGSPGASDRIVVTGDLSLDGTLNLAQSGDPGDGVLGLGYYRLMTYGGALTDNGLEIGTAPTVDGAGFEIQAGGGRVDLFIAAVGDDSLQHWQGGDGVWNASNAQWLNQSGEAPVAWAGNIAVFRNEPGGFDGGTVAVQGTQSFVGLQFVDAGYRLEGNGALRTAAGGSEIRVLADRAEIATEITGTGGIVKTEAGRLVLSGTNSYQGGTTISGGTLEVSADANLGAASGGLVLGGGTLATTASFTSGRAVTLNGAGGFEVAAATTLGLSGTVTGAGDLVKRGDGTLVLTGSNAYGDTRVEAGSLVGNAGSISGAIANAGTVVFDQAGNAAFAGDIGGLGGTNGVMVKLGGGTLTLAGTSQLDWTIEQGGLVTAAERFGGDAAIGENARLVFAQTADATYAGTITGPGDLVKRGSGTLVLTGSNAYGGTQVEAGSLVGNADSISGSIANAGRVVFDQGSDAAFAGDIGGLGGTNGTMVKQGSGTLTLAGTSRLDWTIQQGGLVTAAERFGGDAAIGADGSLVFAQATDATYAGAISGTGALVKTERGSLTLTGDGAGFSGATRVDGGQLIVNGVLGGALEITSGILSGSGTVGTVVLGGDAIVAPGNSIGTLTVAGDITFREGATYEVEVDPTGTESDRIDASGRAVLAGGSVVHVGPDGGYRPSATYTILSAAGGVEGRFGSVASDFAFLTAELSYQRNSVDLEIVRNAVDFADLARTANQRAAAGGAESLGAGNAVYDALVTLGRDEGVIRGAFDALSGEVHASARGALLAESHYVRDAVSGRLRQAASAGAPPAQLALAAAEAPLATGTPERGLGFWSQGVGSWGRLEGDGNGATLDRSTRGLFLGADTLLTDSWRLGVAVGIGRSSHDLDARDSKIDADSYHLAAYSGGRLGGLAVRAGTAFTWHEIDSDRRVSFPGLTERLKAGYSAQTVQGFGEVGYPIARGPVALEPFAGVAFVHQRTEGFRESGGAAALRSESRRDSLAYTTLGLRAATVADVGEAGQVTLRGGAGWQRAMGATRPEARLAFPGGSAFEVRGAPLARDTLALEAGLELQLQDSVALGVSYNGQIARGSRDHGARLNLAIRF